MRTKAILKRLKAIRTRSSLRHCCAARYKDEIRFRNEKRRSYCNRRPGVLRLKGHQGTEKVSVPTDLYKDVMARHCSILIDDDRWPEGWKSKNEITVWPNKQRWSQQKGPGVKCPNMRLCVDRGLSFGVKGGFDFVNYYEQQGMLGDREFWMDRRRDINIFMPGENQRGVDNIDGITHDGKGRWSLIGDMVWGYTLERHFTIIPKESLVQYGKLSNPSATQVGGLPW